MSRVYLNLPESFFLFTKKPHVFKGPRYYNFANSKISRQQIAPSIHWASVGYVHPQSHAAPENSTNAFSSPSWGGISQKNKSWFMTWTRVFEGKNALEIYDVLWRYSYNVIYNVIYIYTYSFVYAEFTQCLACFHITLSTCWFMILG